MTSEHLILRATFNYLKLLLRLDEELGVETLEADYGKLVARTDIVNYLSARVS